MGQVNIVMDNEGRRSGDVYVVLEDADVAYACLEKDKQCMAGFGTRYVCVKKSNIHEMKQILSVYNVYEWDGVVKLRGLPFRSSAADVADFLEGLNFLEDCIYFPLNERGTSMGECYVQFMDIDSAEECLKTKNNKDFMGRYVTTERSSNTDMRKTIIYELKKKYEAGLLGRGDRDEEDARDDYRRDDRRRDDRDRRDDRRDDRGYRDDRWERPDDRRDDRRDDRGRRDDRRDDRYDDRYEDRRD